MTRLRAAPHLAPFGTDPALTTLVTGCARSLVGGPGACPIDGQYQRWDIPAGQTTLLEGHLTPGFVDQVDLGLMEPFSGAFSDLRVAWVAVRNTTTEKTVLVLMISAGPCAGRCVINSNGIVPNVLIHVTH